MDCKCLLSQERDKTCEKGKICDGFPRGTPIMESASSLPMHGDIKS